MCDGRARTAVLRAATVCGHLHHVRSDRGTARVISVIHRAPSPQRKTVRRHQGGMARSRCLSGRNRSWWPRRRSGRVADCLEDQCPIRMARLGTGSMTRESLRRFQISSAAAISTVSRVFHLLSSCRCFSLALIYDMGVAQLLTRASPSARAPRAGKDVRLSTFDFQRSFPTRLDSRLPHSFALNLTLAESAVANSSVTFSKKATLNSAESALTRRYSSNSFRIRTYITEGGWGGRSGVCNLLKTKNRRMSQCPPSCFALDSPHESRITSHKSREVEHD